MVHIYPAYYPGWKVSCSMDRNKYITGEGMLKNTRTTYGGVIKFFHWTMAMLFIGMFGVAYTMTNISPSPVRSVLYDVHKATGLLLFGFFTLRLIWRLMQVQPEVPVSMPLWQKRAAAWNIFALYTVMLLMPVTGFLT